MNLVLWIVFGFIVGLIVHFLEPKSSIEGLLGTLLLGILGSVLGGFLGDLMFDTGITSFSVASFVIAAFGGVLILTLSRLFRNIG